MCTAQVYDDSPLEVFAVQYRRPSGQRPLPNRPAQSQPTHPPSLRRTQNLRTALYPSCDHQHRQVYGVLWLGELYDSLLELALLSSAVDALLSAK